MKIVYTYGAFDILHTGHLIFLKRAKELGDKLIVGIVDDDAIKKLKGKDRPIKTQKQREDIISNLKFVDAVCYQKDYNPDSILLDLKEAYPNDEFILTKGDDWDYIYGEEIIKKIGGKLVKLPYTKEYSSSKLITKMKVVK